MEEVRNQFNLEHGTSLNFLVWFQDREITNDG